MMDAVNQFVENTEGILTHDGEIKVAKGGIKQKILDIGENGSVMVRGRKKILPRTDPCETITFNPICK
jgi:hypothetical protein